MCDDCEMRLDCGQCVLRPWVAGDEPSLVRHANNYKIWRNLRDSFPHPYTLADAEQWISFTQQQSPQTFFAVEVGEKLSVVFATVGRKGACEWNPE